MAFDFLQIRKAPRRQLIRLIVQRQSRRVRTEVQIAARNTSPEIPAFWIFSFGYNCTGGCVAHAQNDGILLGQVFTTEQPFQIARYREVEASFAPLNRDAPAG